MPSPEHTPLNVLVIEDSEDDTQLLLRQLQRSHYSPDHRRVQTAGELRESLREKSWNIIFSDHSMPNFSAPEALAVVKESGQDIPFIVVSGSIGDEQAVAAMKAGANDYIMKDNLSRLGPIVDRELREANVRTQRLRAEATLRESEAVFRALSASSPLGIYTTDASGSITYANRRACEIFGIPAAEALGNTWLQRLPPGDRPTAWSNWKDYVGRGGTSDFMAEHRLQFQEGADRWIRTRVSPVRNEGARVGYVGTIEDVTEFKTAEIALVESEEYNRKLIQEARDVIFSIDPDATIVGLNPAFVTVSGWDTEEWLGKPFLPLVHPEDVASALTNLQQVLVGVTPPPFELRILTKSGSYIDVEFTTYARTKHDHIVGANGIARDVTQRKRLEEQLHQAQKVEAIGSLAGGIAHDFNNILSVIMGYADLAMTELDPESESHHYVNEMNRAAERAAALTRQLLAFSRKQTLQPEVLDLNEAIANLEKMLRRLIGEDLEFKVVSGEGLKPVKVDPSQIEQALMNLVINARDAMPDGGTIAVETGNVVIERGGGLDSFDLAPGEYTAFSVSDTGTGMTPEVKARLFEPFFTTKPEGQGTGLGLSTVHGIIKQSGGTIKVSSEPGAGSRFTVYLPSVDEPRAVDETRKPSITNLQGNETVLVVEDEEPLRVLAVTVLRNFGYEVFEATNGEEALRSVQSRDAPFSLVVTDVVMPQMGGRQLAEQLRRISYSGKILFVSGYTGGTLVQQGITQEKVAFLQKPFTPTSLARKVREVLDSE